MNDYRLHGDLNEETQIIVAVYVCFTAILIGNIHYSTYLKYHVPIA